MSSRPNPDNATNNHIIQDDTVYCGYTNQEFQPHRREMIPICTYCGRVYQNG